MIIVFQMANLTKNQKRDYQKYFIEEGEEGFSPKRNKAIIDRTIKKYEAFKKKKDKEYRDALGERSQALAFYLKSRMAEGVSPVEKYFGKKWLGYLRGQRIKEVLQEKYTGSIKQLRNKVLYLPK